MSATVMQPHGSPTFPPSSSQTFSINNIDYKRNSGSTISHHTTNTTGTGTGSFHGRRMTNRMTNRYSVTAMYSMAAEQDVEVEDELARGESVLRILSAVLTTPQPRNVSAI